MLLHVHREHALKMLVQVSLVINSELTLLSFSVSIYQYPATISNAQYCTTRER